jgi:alkane 1-monooxygenase
VLLYHLQRHSDHHANPTRRYQALRVFDDAPALPTGYAGMILLALVPFAWRRVMDPRVLAHYGGDMSRANISPRKRARVLARYGTTASAPAAESIPAEEVVAVLVAPTGAARCPGCGYEYDEATGAPREGFPAGTPWTQIPDSWPCPDCGVREKGDFVPVNGRR